MTAEPHDLLPARLARWARERADNDAIVVLQDGERETHRLSFAALHRDASAVAQRLGNVAGQGVLILSRSQADFAIAFLGCLYAGAIAVPSGIAVRYGLLGWVYGTVSPAVPSSGVGAPCANELLC